MRVKDEKIFMDSVHGYISIPRCFVKYIIDTDYFQRLRNIDQTGMRILFPNAKHDRFSHSLGVFHLGRKAVSALWNNSRHMITKEENNDSNNKFSKEEWKRNEVLFLLACLLHDIGHTPFSHSLEDLVFENGRPTLDIDKKLIEKLYGTTGENIKIKAASHEKMGSLLLFNDFFKEQIKKVLIDLSQEAYYCHIFALDNMITEDILHDYLCFMARMIMGIPYDMTKGNDLNALRNCFIELLNGPNFDVDNLDYIVRDTQMSGIQNVMVDIERLFSSLCIVTKTIYNGIEMKAEFNVPNKETIVGGKNADSKILKAKGDFVGSILIKAKTMVTIAKNSFFRSLTGCSNDSAKISMKTNECAQFAEYTEIEIDSRKINVNLSDQLKKIYPQNNQIPFLCKIKNAETKTSFTFKAEEDVILTFKNYCKFQIDGAFEVISSISAHHVTMFPNSCIDEIVILDKKENTNNNLANIKRIEYAIGFRKQAINVIANVLEARNYLYLWIYAHHKVVYYTNFLIPVLAKEIFNMELNYKIWDLEYNSLKNLDDSYLWTIIKGVEHDKNAILSSGSLLQKEIIKLIKELMQRKYKYSLYKSLAEFDLFFEQTTKEQMDRIVNKLNNNTNQNMPYLENQYKDEYRQNKYIVGYLTDEFIKHINENTMSDSLKFQVKNIVYVYVDYKIKELKTENIYVNMGDKVVTMADISLLEKQSKVNENNKNKNYFYFYYEIDEIKTEDSKNKSEMGETKVENKENANIEELEKVYKIQLSDVIRKLLTEDFRKSER